MRVGFCTPTWRGAWRESGPSDLLGLSCVFGSTDQRETRRPAHLAAMAAIGVALLLYSQQTACLLGWIGSIEY